jgi:hypothetical protein
MNRISVGTTIQKAHRADMGVTIGCHREWDSTEIDGSESPFEENMAIQELHHSAAFQWIGVMKMKK